MLLFEASNSLQNDNLAFPEVCRRCLSTTTTDSPNHYLVQSVDTGRRVAVLKIPLGGPVLSGLQGLPGRQTAKTLTSDRARRSCTRFDLTITSSSTSFPSSSSSSIFPSSSSCVFFFFFLMYDEGLSSTVFLLLYFLIDGHSMLPPEFGRPEEGKSMTEIHDEYKDRGL